MSYPNNSHLSVIVELEFLNERSEFRNSSSAIQVTTKTKTLFFIFCYLLLSWIAVELSLRFDCILFVSPKRTNTAMTERWSRGLTLQ
ncbi:MAG: hypothetical protein LBG48_00365 [Rickettsiales bacterium]|nr:hypothetical protein [Rickettsiales bacterium]